MRIDEINHLRQQWHSSLVFYITDRCPVGCSHCSVSALSNGSLIKDLNKFKDIVDTISSMERYKCIAITGGEPFAERRGLELAVDRLAASGKRIILYTSGIWAKPTMPSWVQQVLSLVSTVVLSTDRFHRDRIDEVMLRRAVDAIVLSDSSLIVQTLDELQEVQFIGKFMTESLGTDWPSVADLSLISLLPFGRASDFPRTSVETATISPGTKCQLINSPVVKYDGVVTICCNEEVISGQGPDRLRAIGNTKNTLANTLCAFASDMTNLKISQFGLLEAGVSQLEDTRFKRGPCDACWKLQDKLGMDQNCKDISYG